MTDSDASDQGGGDDVARIRDVAVRHHHTMVGEFERRYQLMAQDRFSSAFAYGRHKIDQMLQAELERLAPGSRVLDVGCGTGAYFPIITNQGHQAAGLEPADAIREVAIRDNPGAVVRPGVASALPFDEDEFDLVMAIEVFRYLDAVDVRTAYAEVMRVLKPGGRFFFSMVNRDALDGFWLMQKAHERMTRGGINDEHPHCEFVTPASVSADLEAAGFVDIESHGRLLGPVRLTYKVSTRVGGWIARRVEDVDDRISSRPSMTRFGGHLICAASKPQG